MRMIDIPIKNRELLEILDGWLWFYNNREDIKKYIRLKGSDLKMEDFTSETHLNDIVHQGQLHEGYPDALRGYSLEGHKLGDPQLAREFLVNMLDKGDAEETKANNFVSKCIAKHSEMNTKLGNFLVIKNNALAALYPPDGFISWHNNANASAYNFIFTWSETGEGCFKYIDADTGEEVILQDRKGWNCKAGYFGSYDEHESQLCYHAAETKCWRFTLGFMMNRTEMSLGMQEDVISEISSNY